MASNSGRPLPRPDEDILHQGLAFDLATMRRRQVLRAFGLGAAALGLGACGNDEKTMTTETNLVVGEIPDETAGPYSGSGLLAGSGVVRSDIRSSFGGASARAEGVPMTLTLAVQDLANGSAAFTGVAVYIWQCDRAGAYSLYSEGITGENYLRGVQVADDAGEVTFTSIFPACYPGRWPHVHFEVYPDVAGITDVSKVIATSQVALPENICEEAYTQIGYAASATNLARVSLDDDTVFGEDSGALQLATVTGDAMSGYTVTLEVGVDTTTTPTGGQLTGDGTPSGVPGAPRPSGAPPSR
ncbi:3,4-dioxygenase subunit beta [Actinoplanes sp. NPDC049802]|uniref:dioxygenase family protein n=1 Tax=Actinoplanes sp. NPDC049802 TaxID=3154742 RepID=UPI003405638C